LRLLFRKTFRCALYSESHSTEYFTRVARKYTCNYMCTSNKLFNRAIRHEHSAIIINLVLLWCTLRILGRLNGKLMAINTFILIQVLITSMTNFYD